MIWEVNPINRGLGNRNRFLKLLGVNDKPTPNIINANMKLNRRSRNVYEASSILNNHDQRVSKVV